MKVGITFSAFDLFHAGHVKMLEDAKEQCDYLICGRSSGKEYASTVSRRKIHSTKRV